MSMVDNSNEGELDKYINDLADINDGDDGNQNGGQSDDNRNDGTSDKQSTDQTASVQGADNSGVPVQQAQGTQTKDQQSDKNNQGQQKPQNRPLGDGTFQDAQGNIVDKDGKIVAERGFAARMHHTNRRLRAQLQDQDRQLNEVRAQVQEVQALSRAINSYQLDNQEVAQALDLAGRMKRGDYVGVAKEVIALVAAQGYNVTDLLGAEVGDTIELKAIQRMIDDRLAPVTQEYTTRQEQQRIEQTARANYDRFVQMNEYADVQANDIAKIVQTRGVNPQQAYDALYQFAVENNFDFSQPLGPQIKARVAEHQKQNGGNQQQQSGQRDNNPQRPMPNGAATRTSGAVPQVPLAGADDDWGSIIKSVQATMGKAN